MTSETIDSLSLRNLAAASCIGERPATCFPEVPSEPGPEAGVAWLSNSDAGMLIVTSLPAGQFAHLAARNPHAIGDSM